MKKIMFFIAATVVLAAVGCSKDDAASSDVQYVSELKIGFEGDTRVSTTHDPSSGLKFAWEDGDIIEVWEDKNESASRKMFVYDSSSGSFKPQSDSDKLEVNKQYFATTTSEGYWISVVDGKSVVDMKLGGGSGINKVPMITDVFTATAENTMATMHHIVGAVEIPVKAKSAGAKLQQIVINTQTINQAIRGLFKASPASPYTSFTDSYGYFDSPNQTLSDTPIDLSTTEAKSIFIPAWEGIYSTIDIKYTLVGGSEKTINTNHSLIVERGKVTKISAFTLE